MPFPIFRDLDPLQREIRICEILPANDFHAPVDCTFHTVALDAATDYVPISYVRGDPSNTEFISLNGFPHRAPANLIAGLRRYREKYGKEQCRIWADTICIDQQNDAEWTVQISLLRDIFLKGTFTFAWLGEADGHTDLALDAAVKMKQAAKLKWVTMRLLNVHYSWKVDQPFFCHPMAHTIIEEIDRPSTWTAVEAFFNREFWSRIWIFQEITLSRQLRLCCGSKVIDESDFEALFYFQFFSHHRDMRCAGPLAFNDPLGSFERAWRASRRLELLDATRGDIAQNPDGWRPTRDVISFLFNLVRSKASDPRDRIYGLLSVLINNITASYQKSVQQLYTELAEDAINSARDLEILHHSGIGVTRCAIENVGVPSWVPDWVARSTIDTLFPVWLEIKEAPPEPVARFRRIANFTALIVRGVICETITKLKNRPSGRHGAIDINTPKKSLLADIHRA